MWEAIVNGLKNFFFFVLDQFQGLAMYFWASITGLMPTTTKPTLAAIENFIGFANAWFPLSEMFACLTVYMAVAVGMASFRFVKQFFPTASN